MLDRVGQQLGNYKLLQLLGRGGFAEVYLGEHIYLKTSAAVKILQAQLSEQEDLKSFLKEAQTIAHLQHSHIVRVLDFGVDNETPYLVMDYAPHGTLRNRHARGTRVPLPTIATYVKQIADALQYAHDEHLIHRDIKPENMLVNRHNDLWLSDFGIALIAHSSRYQSTQDVIGTVAYMSPEQIQGKPRPASDQYSLGIVIYEWLSGDRPFHGSFTELCTQHLFAPPPSLCEKVPDLSGQVEQVIATALAKEPKKRFSNIQDLAHALEQASQAESSTQAVSRSLPPTVPVPIPSSSAQSTALPEKPSTETIRADVTLFDKQPVKQSFSANRPFINQAMKNDHRQTGHQAAHNKRIAIMALVALILVSSLVTYFTFHLHSRNPMSSTPTVSQETIVNANYPPVDTISCDSGEQLAYHIHVHLSMWVNGPPYTLPQGVGIAPDGSCIYWLHVHDTTGVIHIEAPQQIYYTLGNFFHIWDQSFHSSNYLTQLSSTSGWTVYVNGKLYTGDFNNIQLTPHTLVTMMYNSPNAKPDTTYNWGGL